MLVTAIIWTYISVVSFFTGLMCVRIIGGALKTGLNDKIPSTIITGFGLCFITTAASYFSIFMKIGLAVNIVILIIVFVYVFIDYKFIKHYLGNQLKYIKGLNIWSVALFIILFLVILFETSAYIPKNYDTASYHAQAIRWIENFPVIPGLGNLNKHFAYNSNWLVASALFSFSFLKIQSFHVLNGFILVLGSLFLISCLNRAGKNRDIISEVIGLLTFPFLIYLFLNFVSSPGTDTAPAVFIVIIFIRFLSLKNDYNVSGTRDNDLELFTLLFLSVFILTLKLSSLPILILSIPLIIGLILKKNVRALITSLIISIIIILPWIIRNVIISGYMIYPVYFTGISGFDWKLPGTLLKDDIAGLVQWSHPIEKMPLWQYVQYWLKSIYFQYKIILYPLLSLYVLVIFFYLLRLIFKPGLIHNYLAEFKKYFWFIIMLYFSIIFLAMTAPDIRYGAAFYLLFFIFQIAPVLIIYKAGFHNKRFIPAFSSVVIILTVLFEVFLFNRYFFSGRRDDLYGKELPAVVLQRIILPADYGKDPARPEEHVLSSDGFSLTIYTAGTSYLAWYDPFPCTTLYEWNLGKGIELRGNSILKGFRIVSKKTE